MLEIKIHSRAKKFLRRIPHKHARQITGKIDALAIDPFPPDSKRLKGMDWYRADVGEYRIAYNAFGTVLDIPLIGKRNDGEIYKRLERLGG